MAEKIKVLMSLNSLGMGGNVIFVMNFFRHINKEKFQVDFMIYDDSKLDFYQEVIETGSQVFVIKAENYKSRKRQIKTVLERENYDIIHVNSCSFKGLFQTILPVSEIKNNIKIIAHAHNPGTPKHTLIDTIIRKVLKFILSSKIDVGFACSKESGESKFTSAFLKSDCFYIINNAIETEKFSYNTNIRNLIRKQFNFENKFVIGSVGRLEEQKNYLFFLDVLRKYVDISSQTVFLLIGEGSQREVLEKKIAKLHLENHVICIGKAKDCERYYQAMDLFVLPSIYEGFGFVNIEAQVSGLPCVVSDKVPPEVDISGEVSFVPLCVEQWVKAIQKRRDHSHKRMTCVTETYDLNCEVKRLEALYGKILNRQDSKKYSSSGRDK